MNGYYNLCEQFRETDGGQTRSGQIMDYTRQIDRQIGRQTDR